MKRCSMCGEFKPVTEFYKNKCAKDGLSWQCKPCLRAYNKTPKRKEVITNWYNEHPDYNKNYREENKEYFAEYFQEYRAKNEDRIQDQRREFRLANQDRLRLVSKAQYERNKDRYKQNAKKRRAKLAGAEGSHTLAEIKALYEFQEGRCVYCQVDLSEGFHEDHWVPLSKGGSDYIDNIQLLCQPCNNRKWSKDPIKFERKIKFNRVAYLFGQIAKQHFKKEVTND